MDIPDCGQEHLFQTNTALVETLLASLHDVKEQLNTLGSESQKSDEPGALTVQRRQSEKDLLRVRRSFDLATATVSTLVSITSMGTHTSPPSGRA